MINDWNNCYSKRWQNILTPDSFAHPAKVSCALAERIYSHAIEEGWLQIGSSVLDCFGGIGGFAYHAMLNGLHWTGIELEEKFCLLGNQNIALWNERYKGKLATWGTAQLIQGDSRKLCEVVGAQAAIVSSPPFGAALSGGGINVSGIDGEKGNASRPGDRTYSNTMHGNHSANLGNLREGDISAVISSPPYVHKSYSGLSDSFAEWREMQGRSNDKPGVNGMRDGYGSTEGQLAGMKEGSVDAVISSPPFVESLASDDPQKRGGLFKDEKRANDKTLTATYGETEGQLGTMKAGALITSPPFEGVEPVHDTKFFRSHRKRIGRDPNAKGGTPGHYGDTLGNIGNQSGETFWAASKTILEQCYQVLALNAKAIFVVKGFIRNKQYVDFPAQWQALCEAVGFKTLHIHRCWLVEKHGEQQNFMGESESIETHRKSFFRRLHEKKYPDLAINYEIVLCMEKAG